MKRASSNDMMEQAFNKLSQVSGLTPPADLYARIVSKIEQQYDAQALPTQAENAFDDLQKIQNLAPPVNLYHKILARNTPTTLQDSKKWFASAAAVVAVLLCLEVFWVMQTSRANTPNNIENIVQKENNQLYE